MHDADLLTSRAVACGIDVSSLQTYIDSFRFSLSRLHFLSVDVIVFCLLFSDVNIF